MPGPLNNQGYTPGPIRLSAGTPNPWAYLLSDYPTGMFVQLVRPPYRARNTFYGYTVPAVAASAPSTPTVIQGRFTLTQSTRLPHGSRYFRTGPVSVIGPGIIFPPVHVTLAPSSKAARLTHSSLLRPKVAATVTSLLAPIRVTLARAPFRQLRTSKLRPPTVVTPAATFIAARIRTRFAAAQYLRRSPRLGATAPQIVGQPSAASVINSVLSVNLAHPVRRHRRGFFGLTAPAVVNLPGTPKYTDRVLVIRTASHTLSRRVARFKLYPPTVVDPPPPPPPPPPPSWSPYKDIPENKHTYTAPELWYQKRKR